MVTNVPSVAQQRIVTGHPINVLTMQEKASFNAIHIPTKLMHKASIPVKFKHYANPMVLLVTGKTISSYKQLMKDPATVEVWQTAFGKDFGGMVQGNNKTGQRGTNAMFVMTRDEVAHALAAGQFFMYANPVVDYRTQKEDPYCIRITARGNLLKNERNVSVRTANLDTAKMHWNSVISTKGAKYMCLDIKKFISPPNWSTLST
jgi:hypothetical protein